MPFSLSIDIRVATIFRLSQALGFEVSEIEKADSHEGKILAEITHTHVPGSAWDRVDNNTRVGGRVDK